MKRCFLILFLTVGVIFNVRAFAPAPGHYFVYFATNGADSYQDGSPLLEGECYALVWRSETLKNTTGNLFYSDGTPVDPENCIVMAVCDTATRTDNGSELFSHATNTVIAVDRRQLLNAYDEPTDGYKGVFSIFAFDTRIRLEDGWELGGKTSETTVRHLNSYGLVTNLEELDVGWDIFMSGSIRADYSFLQGDPHSLGDQDGGTSVGNETLPGQFQITFDANGGAPTPQPVVRQDGSEYASLPDGPSRKGYAFAGWYTHAIEGTLVTEKTRVNAPRTLFAHWTPNAYSIRFNACGGSDNMDDQAMTWGVPTALDINVFKLSGYSFLGWSDDKNQLARVKYEDGAVVSNLTDEAKGLVNLYAVWSPNDNTVTFDGNGGTPDEASRIVKTDAQVGELPTATRQGYTLAGWFTDREKGEAVSADTVIKSNVTYYAQWTANHYEVGFDPRGGEGSMDPQPMTWDEEEALVSNLYARVGYTFLGWTDDEAELEEVLYYDGVVVSNLTDVAGGQFPLYAVWEANHYYVTFDANGGEGEMARQEFTYDQPQALTKNGFVYEDYYFAGWATNGSDEVVYKDGAEVKNLATEEGEEVPLHAVWSLYAVKTVVPGAKVSFSTEDEDVFGEKLVGYDVTGLPNGLKYDKSKGVVSGSVTKETEVGQHPIVFAKGDDVREMLIDVTEFPRIDVVLSGETDSATNGCKVTGAGSYLVGKKATLKLTMPKGTKASATCFLGWYLDGNPWPNAKDSLKTSVSYTLAEADRVLAVEARVKIEQSEQLAIAWPAAVVRGGTFVTGVAGCVTGMPVVVSTIDGSDFSGVKSVKVSNLPSGLKYDAKKGCITGAPTKANEQKTVQVVVTTAAGVEKKVEFEVRTVAMDAVAVGTFSGFVVKDVGGGVWDDVGTFELTVKEDGKLSAKTVTAEKKVSFAGSCWDSVSEDGKYHVVLATKGKNPDTLTLELDPSRPWNEDQLTGTLGAYGVSAQKRAFGTPWTFCCIGGNEDDGWTLAYTNVTKGAPLTVTLKADGSTTIAGTLTGTKVVKGKPAAYKVSASGYANVSLMTNGAFVADFAPVLTVDGKKRVLSIHTRLWMDRSNAHVKDGIGVGDAKFAE